MFTGNCLLSTAMNIIRTGPLETECNSCKSCCYSNNDCLGLALFQLCRSSQGGLDLEIIALKLESIFGVILTSSFLFNILFKVCTKYHMVFILN